MGRFNLFKKVMDIFKSQVMDLGFKFFTGTQSSCWKGESKPEV